MALGRFSAASSLPLSDQSLETVSGVKSRATNTLQVLSLTFVQLHALPLFFTMFFNLATVQMQCGCLWVNGSTGRRGYGLWPRGLPWRGASTALRSPYCLLLTASQWTTGVAFTGKWLELRHYLHPATYWITPWPI